MDQLRDFRDRYGGGVYVRGQQPDLLQAFALNGRTLLLPVCQATFFVLARQEVRCGGSLMG